jgi:hypothetical protein
MLSKIKSEVAIPLHQIFEGIQEKLEGIITYKLVEHKTDIAMLRFKAIRLEGDSLVFEVEATKKTGLAESDTEEIKDSVVASVMLVPFSDYRPISKHDFDSLTHKLGEKFRITGGCPECQHDLLIDVGVAAVCTQVRFKEHSAGMDKDSPCKYAFLSG